MITYIATMAVPISMWSVWRQAWSRTVTASPSESGRLHGMAAGARSDTTEHQNGASLTLVSGSQMFRSEPKRKK